MKRERLLRHERGPDMASEKTKRWTEAIENDSGLDELLAVLGYKVRESEMADVAEKLEQLEAVIGCEGVSQIVSETVHYNPSDLSAWIETMLAELNPIVDHHLPPRNHADCDLKSIPGNAIFASDSDNCNKRLKSKPNFSSSWSCIDPLRTVIFDSQENGIRLVHTLTACAEAVQEENHQLAEALVKQISPLAAAQAGPMRKVATFFAEALSRRIYRLFPEPPLDSSFLDVLQMHFYDACPYFKFAHFTANQAILEAIDKRSCVHVIDFSMNQGMQWPALMQALAIRSGGPPSFRLTGISTRCENHEVGDRLAQFAETMKIEFSCRGFVLDSLSDLEKTISFLDIRPGEAVVMNSVFDLHRLLARPGSVEKLLRLVEGVKPVVFTVVEQESNHNGPVFLDRFMESLHYYSTVFDSLESSPVGGQDRAMSEVYLGQQICNVVACEGVDRVERFEPLVTWRTRFGSAGFEPFRLGSNAFKQASMLLDLFEVGDGYRVEENGGCLLLGWHTRPLVATSAWRPVSG